MEMGLSTKQTLEILRWTSVRCLAGKLACFHVKCLSEEKDFESQKNTTGPLFKKD